MRIILSVALVNLILAAAVSGAGAGKSDIRGYTPSTLLAPDEKEIRFFNNLYTQTESFDDDRERRDDGGRSTYNTAVLTLLRGFSRSVNLGVDLTLKSVRDERFPDDRDSRTALALVSPKLKIAPLRSVRAFAVETGIHIPVASDLDGAESGRPFLDYGDWQWSVRFFFDRPFGTGWLAYFEAGNYLRFDGDGIGGAVTPFKTIVNHYPARRWTLYLAAEYAPEWTGRARPDFYTQIGPGVKFALTPSLELETLYTTFPAGRNKGAGETFNIGFRIVR